MRPPLRWADRSQVDHRHVARKQGEEKFWQRATMQTSTLASGPMGTFNIGTELIEAWFCNVSPHWSANSNQEETAFTFDVSRTNLLELEPVTPGSRYIHPEARTTKNGFSAVSLSPTMLCTSHCHPKVNESELQQSGCWMIVPPNSNATAMMSSIRPLWNLEVAILSNLHREDESAHRRRKLRS